MIFSKETNLFDVTDDDILNFRVDDYSSTISSNYSQYKPPALAANKSEASKVKGISNTLDNFLHKFDFKPRADIVTDTSLEAIVKGAGKFKVGGQGVLVPKASENDLTINSNSNHSVVDNCDKSDLASAENDISFDVFFEDDEDFMKICNDPQHQEDESPTSHKLYNQPSGCSMSSSSNESVDMLPTELPLNCNLKSTVADERAEKKLKNSNDFWALASPCISSNPREIHPSKELLNFSSETVPFLTEFMGKNSSDSFEVSSPRVTAKPCRDLMSQNTKAMTLLRKDDLEFEVVHSKSPVPVNNSTWLAKLSKNHSSHKARKRKFPGPAGLLPDLPLRSPLDPKQHDYSLELNASENIDDQEFLYSQSSADDFLSAPWANMTRDLATHNNLALLTKFNIRSVRKQASKKKLPKHVEVPFFCVLLKSFVLKDSEVITTFKDETGEISGKIHQEVIDKYRDSVKVGSVIVLKKAVFLFDRLSIKLVNIVSIYDPNGSKICIDDWNGAVLCENIRHSSSKPPQCPDQTSANKDGSQEYIVELMEDSLFEDDFNDIVSTIDESSFLA